jgi:hypothetical protein
MWGVISVLVYMVADISHTCYTHAIHKHYTRTCFLTYTPSHSMIEAIQ